MIIKCDTCSKQYYICPAHYKRAKTHHCSRKCFGLGEIGINNVAFKESWIKTCFNCGKKYRYKDSHGKKFCSQKCMGKYKSKMNSKNVPCKICGKIIHKINARKANCCSKECANKLHSKRMTGSGNTNWINGTGKAPYGWEFNNKLKEKIRNRDKRKCRLCGNSEKKIRIKKGQGLAIHHIDYDKTNNKKDNLISLCNTCHGYTHYNRLKWKQELLKLLKK